MSFFDYDTTPSANTQLGDGTFIGPNMERDKVRPALQQLAADGASLALTVDALGSGALATSNIYGSVPEGLAATPEGGFFSVASDEVVTLYQKVSGAAVAYTTFGGETTVPGASAVSAFEYVPVDMQAAIQNYTSTADVSTYVQQACSQTNADSIYLPPGKWNFGAEIDLNGRNLFGAGPYRTKLYSIGSQRSVVKLTGQKGWISNLSIDGTNSTNCIYATGSNGGRIDMCLLEKAKQSGICIANVGNNSEMEVTQCLIRNNGKRISCGTATGDSGATTVSISGVDPTSLGIRVGYDFLKIAGEVIQEVTAVTSGSVSIYPGLSSARSGATAQVYQGSGLEIQRSGDNSNIKSLRNEYQGNALFGVDCSALYGVQSDGDLGENNAMVVAIGRRAGGGEQQVINWAVKGLYSEANTENAHIYHGSSREGYVENPTLDLIGNNGLDFMYVVDPNTLRSLSLIGIEGVNGGPRRGFQINSGDTQLYSGQTCMFAQGSGDFTVTLVPPTAGSNGSRLASLIDMPITILLENINSTTCNIRSTMPINGVAVAGTYSTKAVTGSNQKLEARWKGDGWLVTSASGAASSLDGSWVVYTGASATLTGGSATLIINARYKKVDKTVFLNYSVRINGSLTGTPTAISIALPFPSVGTSTISGKQVRYTPFSISGHAIDGATDLSIHKYDGSNPLANDLLFALEGA